MNDKTEYKNIGEYIKAAYPKHYESVCKRKGCKTKGNDKVSLRTFHKMRLKKNSDDFKAKVNEILQKGICH